MESIRQFVQDNLMSGEKEGPTVYSRWVLPYGPLLFPPRGRSEKSGTLFKKKS